MIARILKEPVVQFALIGVALFVYFQTTAENGPAEAATAQQVEISEAEIARMLDRYRTVWRRPPSLDELQSLVDTAIREEILVREALTLGLDRGDAAIRNRLRQKMQFLTDSAAQSLEPGDNMLQAHLDANPDRFALPPRIGFEQIYLGTEAGADAVAAIRAALDGGAAFDTLGERSLLPAIVPSSARVQVDGGFGTGFFDALAALEPGEWAGPVSSGFGLHLVRVTERTGGTLPDLAEIRDKVLFDWRREQAQTLAEAQYQVLSAGYEVIAPDTATLERLLQE